MDIRDRTILLLGGSGLVGMAIARRVLEHRPRSLIISALTRDEAEAAVASLQAEEHEQGLRPGASIEAEWGDLFVPASLKDRPRSEVLKDAAARSKLLDDLFGELTEGVVEGSALGALLLRRRPDIVVDCVNTATAFAYQNVFESALSLRVAARSGTAGRDAVERHLTTLYLPQLIRHVQIALEALRRAGTTFYLKVGTSGTGGMGLNVPFTHSEERPSRMLLSKAGLAGAHTLLLYLMARTPDAPVVKEVKPTAAISWKRIGYGEIAAGRRALRRYDAVAELPLEQAFADDVASAYRPAGGELRGVFLDAGENGLFSLPEFEVLTSLGLMEFITPEEIADNVLREIRGQPTGRDVVAALDASTSGPTYRAGVLRQVAIEQMEALEREHGVSSVAFEMLGPPRLSKLLFEATILGRLFPGLTAAALLDPAATAERAAALIAEDAELRVGIVTIGLAVLLPDGRHLLRGPVVKVAPGPGQPAAAARLAESGWVDLRPANWEHWRGRLTRIAEELRRLPGPELGSRSDLEAGPRQQELRPGRLAAWVFRNEDRGERMKR
jgi:NAD(P)-dependent dehydrogenase (short-subunit alcohol dehydrogenase family)